MTSFGENVQNPNFWQLIPQIKIFFKIMAVPWTPNFMKSLEKTDEQSLRYLKTD